MRILHFREAFSALSETFIYDSYIEQLNLGLDCHFATLRRVDAESRPAEHVHLVPVPSRAHPARILSRIEGRLRGMPRAERPYLIYARGLRELVQRLHPRVLHAHFGTAGVIAELATRDLPVSLMVTFYGYDISRLPSTPGWLRHYSRLFARASQVLVLSANMQQEALALGANPAKTRIVHLSRKLEDLPFSPREGAVRRWLSVGRLVEKKGMADAISAVAMLRARQVPVELDVVGDGPLLAPLVERVERLGLNQSVRFLGALPSAEVVRALRETDAFLLCSKTASDGDQEGTPTVLIEAQAIGRPCVSTLHAGIPEMFAPDSRWTLAPEGSVADIAERMARVIRLSDQERAKLVRAGREHVESGFSSTSQALELARLYRELAESGSEPGTREPGAR